MAFAEVNPVTNKTWTREELWLAYQSELACVTQYMFEASEEHPKLISWSAQWENLKARWEIHRKEWKAATKDVAELGKAFRGHLEELQEVVTAPVLKQ